MVLNKLTGEMNEQILTSHVDRITMPAKDLVILNLRCQNGSKRLLISARPAMSRIHITETEYENPSTPPSFCMLLRKYLNNGRIIGIRAVEGERLIIIDFAVINEKGDRTTVFLSVEMMGRYSNIILVNGNNIIIDALRHILPDTPDKRRIFPGVYFELPPKQNKLSFMTSTTDEIITHITKLEKPLSSAILDSVAGIGPVVAREIAMSASITDRDADLLNEAERLKLTDSINAVKKAADPCERHCYAVYDNGVPVEYSFIPLTQYAPLSITEYDSVSKLLDSYFSGRERAELIKSRSTGLKKQINTILERTIRRQRSREEEQNSSAKAELAKLYGELLTVNQRLLTRGMTTVKLTDYYTGREVEIPLDPQRTPSQNAQRYYREYRKLTTAKDILARLLEEGENEISYLESVRYEAETASTEEEFLAIREELHAAGYLKAYKLPKKMMKPKTRDYIVYRTTDGFRVVVGRNNAANDRLSLKTASKNDIWFHVKYGPGSHTVLILDNKTPTDLALSEAAGIAAYHSSHAHDGLTAVDYTCIKNVKKAPGQKTGMVVYSEYSTIYTVPGRELIESLPVET